MCVSARRRVHAAVVGGSLFAIWTWELTQSTLCWLLIGVGDSAWVIRCVCVGGGGGGANRQHDIRGLCIGRKAAHGMAGGALKSTGHAC
eukprot:COSAG06_NODE_37667_length_432_cov_1.240240_1_plen_89_part_00